MKAELCSEHNSASTSDSP